MTEEKKKSGNGCLIAFLVFLGIIAALLIGGYFYFTGVFLPKAVNRVLVESGAMESLKENLSDADINLTNENLDELINITEEISSKDISRVITSIEQKGESITTSDLFDIIDKELEVSSLEAVKENGGWEVVKANFTEQIDDRQVQVLAAYLKNNPGVKKNLPRMTKTIKKSMTTILEDMKE